MRPWTVLLFAIPLAAQGAPGPSIQRLAPPGYAAAASASEPFPNHRKPLRPGAFMPLPFGSVRPRGYLAGQMKLQASGLTAHLGDIFPDVGPNSAWRGGSGENWERGPYYTRGLVALAYASRDPAMIAKAKPWIEWVLSNQRADGAIQPMSRPDWWPRMIVLQYLSWYQEATGDKRVIPFMQKALRYQLSRIESEPLAEWAVFRGGDNLEPIYWLYDRTGDAWLLRLASILQKQTYDWTTRFSSGRQLTGGSFVEHQHGVNLAQALKMPALWSLQDGSGMYRQGSRKGLDLLFRYYGQAHGLFTGEEAVVPSGSRSGTELCQTVEYLHSLGEILPILGDASLGDRMEKAAFNALPAALKPDMKGYQYYILPNEAKGSHGPHGFGTDHGSNLAPGGVSGYPCCAVNMHYAWPYFSQRIFLAAPGGGLAAALYAPCEVRAKVAGGSAVTVVESTSYPFQGSVTLRLSLGAATRFPFHFRIPGWCQKATITINGKDQGPVVAESFHKVDRKWNPGDVVVLDFPMELRTSEWENKSAVVERGPLVYALKVAEEWWPIGPHPELKGPDIQRFHSWEVRPRSAWNLALILDRAHPGNSLKVVSSARVPSQPFAPDAAPVMLLGKGRKLPKWGLDDRQLAAPPPWSPVKSDQAQEPVTLIPFGCGKLRVTYLPWIQP